MRESAVTSHIKLAAAQNGCELWRNNSGGFFDESGRFVRFGLGSFTPNQHCASSDYIGIRPVLITPEMIGQVLGVFLAVEIKAENWSYRLNDKHTADQQRFIDIVNRAGGFAGFARSVDEFKKIARLA